MAEPTKLTQAQALFAVLAGAAQSRRERVYYRDGVLRSTLYPLRVDTDILHSEAVINWALSRISPVSTLASAPSFIRISSRELTVELDEVEQIACNPVLIAISSKSTLIQLSVVEKLDTSAALIRISSAVVVVQTTVSDVLNTSQQIISIGSTTP